jgi:hypothetical protein
MKNVTTLRCIFIEAVGLVVLHVFLLRILAKARLLEHLLSPGSKSSWPIAATASFLLLRTLLYVVGPGWFMCRLWFWFSKPLFEDGSQGKRD